MSAIPSVSVIIPVHNAGEHLRGCLESVRSQTLRDIEVLCVDDVSTDGSRSVIEEYCASDGRFSLLEGPGRGAGAARNVGLEAANGDLLAFLDADDLFDPRMLEAMSSAAREHDADVVMCASRYLDDSTGEMRAAKGLVRFDLLPEEEVFSRVDLGEDILLVSTPAPWNKLFDAGFVRRHGLRFQETRRTNDLLFTKLATVLADRITVVDEVLVTYRVGGGANLQSGNDQAPTEFLDALRALRDELVARDLYQGLSGGFANMALATSLYVLGRLRRGDAFRELYAALRDGAFDEFSVSVLAPSHFRSKQHHERYLRIIENEDPLEYLIAERDACEARLAEVNRRRETLQGRIARIERSRAFRLAARARKVITAARSAFRTDA